MLPERIGAFAKFDQSYVLYHPEHRVIAYLEKKPKYTQCLITDAVFYDDKTPAKLRRTYELALNLAQNFTVSELQDVCRWPAPKSAKAAISSWDYVSEVTGEDLNAPLDRNGKVTYVSLDRLNGDAIKTISARLNIVKGLDRKKETLIRGILQVHPLAARSGTSKYDSDDEELPPTVNSKKKRRYGLSRSEKLSLELFMRPSKKPKFVELYTECYGAQDRMNAILYATFDVSSRPTPETKPCWTAICLSLYNVYTLWSEHRAASQENVQLRIRTAKSTPAPDQFFLELFLELADHCYQLAAQGDEPLSRRSSLGSVSSEAQ